MAVEKIICKKCLLAEMNDEKLKADIDKAIRLLKADAKVSDDEYARRLSICKECDDLHEGTCNKCGCYVELRAATKISDCPYHKWSKALKSN